MIHLISRVKRTLILLLLMVLPFASISCSYAAELIAGDGYTSSTRRTLKNTMTMIDSTGTKSVVLVPMIHVGKAKDYEKIKEYLDDLKADGYVTFFEQAPHCSYSLEGSSPMPAEEYFHLRDSLKAQSDSAKLDTLRRKLRRGAGGDPFAVISSHSKHGKIYQYQSMDVLGLTTSRDYWTDMSIADMIRHYEETHSEIELSEYDWKIPLDDPKYSSRKAGGSLYGLVTGARDEHLLSFVLSSDFNKIAVVYGAIHTLKLRNSLELDYNYKRVKRK
jgi:hypothetical protein